MKSTKTALITGASSGIGKAFTLALASEREWNLILVARNLRNLNDVKQEVISIWGSNVAHLSIKIISIDLALDVEREDLLSKLKIQSISIDLLINNAGCMTFEHIADQKNDCTRSINLHCIAPVHLCTRILPTMLERGEGSIINVCSLVAAAPMPFSACYAASKVFLLSFSLAITEEIKSEKIRILALCPGPTNTPGHMKRFHLNPKRQLKLTQPEDVVKEALIALRRGSKIHIVGFRNKILFYILRALPIQRGAQLLRYSIKNDCLD